MNTDSYKRSLQIAHITWSDNLKRQTSDTFPISWEDFTV